MTKHKTALVLGATGLVGKKLLAQLKVDNRYASIICGVRKLPVNDTNSELDKVKNELVDFDNLNADLFKVDHVYVCLGTTIKKAGAQQAFRLVDYDYVLKAAQLAAKGQVESFVWISSVGADASSTNFYLRVKGELERDIAQLSDLDNASCVQPSLLLGQRDEFRLGEKLGVILSPLLSPLLIGRLAKYKPVRAEHVAHQMIELQHFD